MNKEPRLVYRHVEVVGRASKARQGRARPSNCLEFDFGATSHYCLVGGGVAHCWWGSY